MRRTLFTLFALLLGAGLLPQIVFGADNWTIEGAGSITSISVAEDGGRLAVGSYGAKAYVYGPDGKEQYQAQANNVVTGVELLAGGELLVASDDRHLYAYDGQGKPLWNTNLKKQVTAMSASRDGSVIAVILQRSNEIAFIDGATGEVRGTAPIGTTMRALKVSANGQWIAAATTDQYVYLLDGQGKQLRKMGAADQISAVAVSDEGAVAAATASNEVELFDAGGKGHKSLPTRDDVTDVSFSRDGKVIGASDLSGGFYLFGENGKKLWETNVDAPGRNVELDRDGKTLYAGTEDGRLFAYDTGQAIGQAKSDARLRTGILIAVPVLILALMLLGLRMLHKRRRLGVFRQIWRAKLIYLGLAPTFVLLIAFLYVPAFSGLFHSLYDWQPGGRTIFVGLDNFKRMFHDAYVTKGLGNLLILIVTGLIKSILPPLITAELIYHLRSKRLQYVFRTSFTASMIIPGVALLLIWQNLYDPNVGLINNFLQLIGLGGWAHGWLGDPKSALWAVIFIGFPFVGILQLLVLYAGLLSIPGELIESAKMDGASLARIIRSIHLPLLAGQFKFLIILTLIGTVQDFNGILIVTGGGPMDSTYVPALQMYYAATKFNDLGYASALGVGMFLVILVITVINLKVIKTANE
ncbi:PQQ-binding-like beta-propeller repeat protein [Paenibacillus sp. MWE-103]|uniref:PQQ-binding-like beta-propeller repeat protein n=1 Tax=Paenibacillus artemisiicola TaxID=1172618 RepID=A0ABS3W5Q4_9BACL|nr:PQQ-binding-like beta-propeller repeat protein [Paenibacillus artemisiicola]MBO7743633.1 PQQ-binding-like beta-propeller repeat protein [Paenibacillus artemisiicola]